MNCFGAGDPDSRLQKKRSDEIDRELRKEKLKFWSVRRLLLLGDHSSGKSTIMKQVHIIHGKGYSAYEKKQKIGDIKSNIRDAITTILYEMASLCPPVQLEKPENQFRVNWMQEVALQPNFDYPPEFYEHTKALWKDRGVQSTYERNNEYELIDCAKYFLDQIDIIKCPDYMPTKQDILRCRENEKPIFESQFQIKDLHFHLLNVDVVRHDRRRWIRCFNQYEDLAAVIFVAECSSYDIVMPGEDPPENKLQLSLDLFKSISGWVRRRTYPPKQIIVFLNKQDLLAEKILAGKSKLEDYFVEFANYQLPYVDSQDYNEHPEVLRAKYFIRDKFLRIAHNSDVEYRQTIICLPYFTCAVDTEHTKEVLNRFPDLFRCHNCGLRGDINFV